MLTALPLLAALVAAPVVAPSVSTNQPKTIDVGGLERSYVLHVPKGHDASKPVALVMVLHGHGSSAASMVKITGFDAIADREGFVVAYLQGTKGSDGKANWNNGIQPELGFTVNDVKFTRAVAKQLVKQLGIDPKKIYAAGHSGGAFMSYRLAAAAQDLFAAVGIVEGTVGLTDEDGAWHDIVRAKAPISLAIIHGKLDGNLPWKGDHPGASGHQPRSVADAITRWTKTDGCAGRPVEKTLVPDEITTTDYKTCDKGTEVLLFMLEHGEHAWPSTDYFSPAEALWKFFARHPRA